MESTGGFGDLLAAFNIDSEDTDIAYATSQYDEVNPNDVKVKIGKDSTQGEEDKKGDLEDGIFKTELKDETNQCQQIVNTAIDGSTNVESLNTGNALNAINTISEAASTSLAKYVQLPNLVPLKDQISGQTLIQAVNNQTPSQTVLQAVNNTISQLPAGTVLLSNLPQPNIATTIQPFIQPPLQSFVQPVQARSLPGNQISLGGQSFGILGSNNLAGITGINGEQVLLQQMPQILPRPQANQAVVFPNQNPSLINVGANQNGLITAVPMSFLPQVMNQNISISPVPSVTPSPPLPDTFQLSGLTRVARRFVPNNKARPSGNTPTVQELLDERRRQKQKRAMIPAVVSPVEDSKTYASSSALCIDPAVKLRTATPICNTPAVAVPSTAVSNNPDFKSATAVVKLNTSEIKSRSGRRRQQTQRYLEFMSNKDDSEEEIETPKVKGHRSGENLINRNHQNTVIDVNKPITDQLIGIIMSEVKSDETDESNAGIQVSNDRSLESSVFLEIDADQGPSVDPETDSASVKYSTAPEIDSTILGIKTEIKTEDPMELNEDAATNSGISIKQEPVDTGYDDDTVGEQNTVAAKKCDYVSQKRGESLVLPDGMRIKKELIEKQDLSIDTETGFTSITYSPTVHIKSEPHSPGRSEEQKMSEEDDGEPSLSSTDREKEKSQRKTKRHSPNKEPTRVSSRKRKSTVWIPAAKPKSLTKKVKIELGLLDSNFVSKEKDPAKVIKNTIKTREQEERIATEAAARAASSALLRVTTQAKEEKKQKTATELLEASLKQLKYDEQKRTVRNAAIEIQAAATRAASEAAARAASQAMARMVAETTESVPSQSGLIVENKIKEAEAASKAASEAALRAVAEAAATAAARAAVVNVQSPLDIYTAEKSQHELENATIIASLAAARAAAQAAMRINVKSVEDLVLEEKAAIEADKARQIASEAATRAAAARALEQSRKSTLLETETIDEITKKTSLLIQREEAEKEFRNLVAEATAKAVMAAHTRTSSDFVPILPAPGPACSYSKPTHIKQILKTSKKAETVKPQKASNVALVEPMIVESTEVNKVLTPDKQIISYPKNPSKNLRESLAWKSFHDGVKQGKYQIVQKAGVEKSNGKLRGIDDQAILLALGQDMRCPYCLIPIKLKINLMQHVTVCLLNPQTNDEDYLTLHRANDAITAMPAVCTHCSPTASSVKDTKKWSNVLCRLCVTNCAHSKIAITIEDHHVITKSGFYVCKHCGIGLDNEADMKLHLSTKSEGIPVDAEENTETVSNDTVQMLEENKGLPVSKILTSYDSSYQYRCGHCRLMFASVGFLLVHTSHCNLDQYFKLLERLSYYNCINCPAACKVVPNNRQPHQCEHQQTSSLSKTLQAYRDNSVTKESFVCLRCEKILPSNGHLILHTKQCNHAQYHLLMRYIDQPPYCNKCLMVFTGYRAYAQHSQRCLKVASQYNLELEDYSSPSVCSKCTKSVEREDVDQMYHDATCVGLPCTQQKLLFPEGFNIKECCTLVNSW